MTRALIVDDSLTVRMDLDESFREAGFETTLADGVASARAALAAADAIDIVVLDVLLPDGDGIELLAKLKASPATAALPVMLLSSEAEVGHRVCGLRTGADEYIGKPYDATHVVARARHLVGAATLSAHEAQRTTVLVVDDSATSRAAVAALLEAEGYRVLTANTGEEGLRIAALARPTAMVVDGDLGGGIDGNTVVRRLREDAGLRGLPCILLTGSDAVGSEIGALDAGADAFVRKDADPRLILARVAAVLRAAGPAIASAPSILAPQRVLAVDDSATYLRALGDVLRDEGYDAVLATSGEEALDLLAVQPVDAILLDLMMPGLSGHETCRRIKASAAWRDVPLIMLTALDEREAMLEGLRAGADDYITKSADFEVLKARLRAQIRRRRFEEESRRVREELVRQQADARFQTLVHSSLIGVLEADLDGRIRDANAALLALLGRTHAELVAGELSWAAVTPEGAWDDDRNVFAGLRRRERVEPWERELVRTDGVRVPALIGLTRVAGTETCVGFVVDRREARATETKLRRYAADLERAKDRAERESRFKSRFVAGMSHELRTPLNAIIGFSELLEQELFGPLLPVQHDYVQNVLSSGRHLLSLINDILDLSKVEAGRMALECEWTSVAALVEAAEAIVRPLAAARELTLTSEIARETPAVYVDPLRMRQVLYNLLSNAIKFTEPGGAIQVRASPVDGRLLLAVTDTGVGIAAEDAPRLFREFDQIVRPGVDRPEGTGLGLTLTRRLVELHGGTIDVSSELGRGSTFSVNLPMLRRPSDASRPLATPDTSVSVLVVEDDPRAASLLATYLRAAGLTVGFATAADEALRLADELQPDAITLDLLMPGTDGWEILAGLKGSPATRHIPVIIVSVVDDPGRGLVLGADDYLVKPVTRDRLLGSLEEVGVALHRVAGLTVVIAGAGNGELERTATLLHQAGCVVRREPSLGGDLADIDALLVDLGASLTDAGFDAALDAARTAGVPILGLAASTGADATLRDGLEPLAWEAALSPERLIQAVRRAVDRAPEPQEGAP